MTKTCATGRTSVAQPSLGRILVLLMLLLLPLSSWAQWKNFLSYQSPTEIEKAGDGTLYVLASGALYSYNPDDQSLQTFDKTNGLSDCAITHIAWCQAAHRLVIVYDDYNVDLLAQNGNVVNLPNYMNASMTGEKTVNSLDVSGRHAYLSTAFGIVNIDVDKAEFSDTYQLGFAVNYTYVEDGYLYAASRARGLYRGLMTDNLLDPDNWARTGNYTARPKTMNPDDLAMVNTLSPGGPKYNYFGFMRLVNGKLYACNGNFLDPQPSLQMFDGNQWTTFSDQLIDGEAKGTRQRYRNVLAVDVDPRDETHVMAGAQNGLYEYRNFEMVNYYNCVNSLIEPYNGRTTSSMQMVTGLKYDSDGNLWLLNSQAPTQSLIEYSAAGQWSSHAKPALMRLNDGGFTGKSLGLLVNPIIDSRGLLWFVNNHYTIPSFYAYQSSNDGLNAYDTFYNEDGTQVVPSNGIRCVVEDREGNMWVGTDMGPLELEVNQITAENPVFTQVKVPRNDGTDYADYLLAGVDVYSMAVDQYNRKWFGTNGSGLYLISSDNLTQVEHFTKENSPLLSNIIVSLAINDATGELFIGTDNGLCSYTPSSVNPDAPMTKDNVYAYPNPVRPEYNGPITITGLQDDADVKIVTATGTLVNEGRAANGRYVWYGTDRKGKRVASGVYMVLVATAEGDKGVVCKVAVVN